MTRRSEVRVDPRPNAARMSVWRDGTWPRLDEDTGSRGGDGSASHPHDAAIDRRSLLLAMPALAILARPAAAQAFPARAIRMVLGAGPGSAPDVAARLMSEQLSTRWRQPVVVENRPAANGNLAAQLVAAADGDGHTLLFAQASILLLNQYLMRNPGFDPQRDFAPISLLMATPFLICTGPNHPVRSLADLVTQAKAAPGRLNFATSSGTNLPRFAGELLCRAAGIEMTNVPYSSMAGAVQDTIAGRCDFIIEGTPVLTPQVRGGQMRPLGITGSEPFPGLEKVPLIAAAYPAVTSVGWFGLVGPKAMPGVLVRRIQADAADVLASPALRERLLRDFGSRTVASDPEDFASFLGRERDTYRPLIAQVGATLD